MTIDEVIAYIAMQEHTTAEIIRAQMADAMEAGQRSTDPNVQALWNAIPRKGAKVTPEELIEYLAGLKYS